MSKIKNVSEDIIRTNFGSISKEARNMFYEIAKRNGIKKCTRSKDGRFTTCDNPEWVMCKSLFITMLCSAIECSMIFDFDGED